MALNSPHLNPIKSIYVFSKWFLLLRRGIGSRRCYVYPNSMIYVEVSKIGIFFGDPPIFVYLKTKQYPMYIWAGAMKEHIFHGQNCLFNYELFRKPAKSLFTRWSPNTMNRFLWPFPNAISKVYRPTVNCIQLCTI